MEGVVVGEGDTYNEAVADVQSAIKFHIETFGEDSVVEQSPILEAYLTEAMV
jgi:predicted RNase H-like HicB family nuclease